MTAEFFPIDQSGRQIVATDLTWVLGSGWSIADLAGEYHATAYVQLSNAHGQVVGLVQSLPKTKNRRVHSLGALCAAHAARAGQADAAYFLQLSTSAYAMVGVLDGLPVIGYDRSGLPEDLLPILDKFRHDADQPDLLIHSNRPDDLPGAIPLDLGTLAEILDDKTAAAAVRLVPVPHNFAIAIVIVAMALSIAGWLGWDWWQQQEAQERARQALANRKPPQALYDESLPAAFAKSGWSVGGANAVMSRMATVNLHRGGWKVEKISCSFTLDGCVAVWSKQRASATFATFMQQTPEGEKSLTFSAERISEKLPIQGQPLAPIPKEALKPLSAVFGGAISRLQRLVATGEASLTFRQPVPFAAGKNPAVKPVMRGDIEMSGSLYLFPMALDVDANHLSVSAIEVVPVGNKPGFKINMNYYVTAS